MTESLLSDQFLDNYQNNMLGVFGKPALVLDHGKGSEVFDVDGNVYIDLLGGIAVNCLGYCHEKINNVIIEQCQKMIHHSNFFTNKQTVELAKKLIDISGVDEGSKVFFTNSGAESNELALKIVKKHMNQIGGKRIIALTNSFHGRTLGALSLTYKSQYKEPFSPLIPNIEFIEANNLDKLELAFSELATQKYGQIAGMFIETIQGEAGVKPLSAQYIARCRELTKRNNALLVIDEVQTGMGRTGSWFSYQNQAVVASADISPDIITMAKSLGDGFPIGAVITNGETVSNILSKGEHGSTFGGNPLAAKIANEVISIIEDEKLLQRSGELAIYISKKILDWKNEFVKEIRGAGALLAVELSGEFADRVAKRCLSLESSKRVIINAVSSNSLRFAPAFNIDADILDEALDILNNVILEEGKSV